MFGYLNRRTLNDRNTQTLFRKRKHAAQPGRRFVAAAILSGQRDQSGDAGDCRRRTADSADDGNRHRQNSRRVRNRLKTVPDPLEPETGRLPPPPHSVPSRPQHTGRSGLQRFLRLSGRCPGADQAGRNLEEGSRPDHGNIFFTIFESFMSGPNDTPYFGDYPNDYFDFIIIDECHRGGEETCQFIFDGHF